MRITGGKARGISLKAPKDQKTRPATDRTRESLFSSLTTSIIDVTCLDLFAGTGSYGFEALSRGAQFCQFIEHNRTAIDCLKQNAQAIKKSAELRAEAIQIKRADLLKENADSNQKGFDFIFLDPPYALWESHSDYLLNTLALGYANENTQLILECPGDLILDEISSYWSLKKRLGKESKGKPNILIYKCINSAS